MERSRVTHPSADPSPVSDPTPLDILLEDNHLLAANKPPGLLTQPSGTGQDSLEARAKEWVRRTKGKPGAVFLHAVHRLDREVSGVVLFARTSKALARLNEALRGRSVEKIYHAVVEGTPPNDQGTLEHWLTHGSHRAQVSAKETAGAKHCTLAYRLIQSTGVVGLVEVRLLTGRYHQIRAQLAAVGCPILGDARYGSDRATPGRIALHHRRMELDHPVREERVVIEAGYPAGWPDVRDAAWRRRP